MHHVHVMLPEGQLVTADFREDVVWPMRRYLQATAVDHTEPKADDVEAIRAWWLKHPGQSELCQQYQCTHYL